ncbi:MAG TPA: hypothetical protein VLC46_00080 [Thermoanaerobaculia bacterium]|jgi:hypothetical protein|nr:hypothetical protein [Thermoanaerobaculia bacterium]
MDDGRTDETMPTAIGFRTSPTILVVAGAVLVACFPSHEIAKRSRAAIVVAGARNVGYSLLGQEESIAYDVVPPPTIEATRQVIDRELGADGWSADAPEKPHSVVDVQKGIREPVEQWHGTWRRGEKVAEYILERRPDRLHVWGRVGPPESDGGATRVVTNTAAIPEPDAGSIEVGPNDAIVFCGPSGAAAITLTNVTQQSATANWRFLDSGGRESFAQTVVSERPGSKPKEIDASGAHFQQRVP